GGKDYSMRIWVDPDLLAAKGLTFSDVAAAVREQNQLYAAGEIGAEPNENYLEMTFPVTTRGRLEDPAEFEEIVLRATPGGATVRLKDVARVELGSLSYNMRGRLDGKETAFIIV